MMNDDTERPAKRPRSLDDDAAPPSDTNQSSLTNPSHPPALDLKRHEEFWFEDGNVVLVAQNTAFRVFRSLLAEHSTVFADMFATSTPTTGETYDGCPVVRLSDSPHELTHLLRIIIPTKNSCQ